MVKSPSIEEACGYKQVFSEDELKGKIIKNTIIDRHEDNLYLVFTDNTFAHVEITDSDSPRLEFEDNRHGEYAEYRALFEVYYGGGDGSTWENPNYKLTELGKAMNADLEKLKQLYIQERKDWKKYDEDKEYQQYLRLKEKYEGKQ